MLIRVSMDMLYCTALVGVDTFTFISMLSIQYNEFAASCASTGTHN